jgi:luciferase-like monooxygenase
MTGAALAIERAVTGWPGVVVAPHRFGGREFRLDRRELAHLHGDSLLDVPFPVTIRRQLVADGRASVHHVLPDSGWVSFQIRVREDIDKAIALIRLNYDRPWLRGQPT